MAGFKFFKKNKISNTEIFPDEILIDSHNLPRFDTQQFEGKIERPITRLSLSLVFIVFFVVLLSFCMKIWTLQIKNGDFYAQKSENNRLRKSPIFASRGVVFDRNNLELIWNAPTDEDTLSLRKYTGLPGLSHVLGYVQYPSKDSAGFYYQEDFKGIDGVEKYFNTNLTGKNGIRLIEVDARGKVQSQNTIQPPKQGDNLNLSIDAGIQSQLYKSIEDIAKKYGFTGGAGVIMDTRTGEIISMTSYPEYKSEIMSEKSDRATINSYLNSKNKPFLDRVVDGLYTPGSIVKPYLAVAALNENIISPEKEILSTGSISIQNQYLPDLKTTFRDWKAHGYTDMRRALAVSSDVYFYAVGGGYKDQKGLGITKIEKYMRLFGFGEKIQDSFFTGAAGVIPNPKWKADNFDGEAWSLGNTYHTSIGQYGFQVSPIQMVRAVAAIVNNGKLRDPSILKGVSGKVIRDIDIPASYFKIVREGMRLGVKEGTGSSLNVPYVNVATKSGTAELGIVKDNVNSWMTGFFPYENPKYAFAVIMEHGSIHNLIGAGTAMRETLDWMNINTPSYFKVD